MSKRVFQTEPLRNSGVARLMYFCLALFVFASGPAFGEEIDRLVASVNGAAITEGDIELARSLNEILSYGRTTEAGSRSDEIERLIDQELMRQELKNFSVIDEESGKVEARMQTLRDAYSSKGGLPALLQRIGLQETELISYIRLESAIMNFVNFRFRPFISVSVEEIQAYYENRLKPQLQKSRIELPALEQVSEKIAAIVREEKINTVLEQWIKEIRRNSHIEYFTDAKQPDVSRMP